MPRSDNTAPSARCKGSPSPPPPPPPPPPPSPPSPPPPPHTHNGAKHRFSGWRGCAASGGSGDPPSYKVQAA
ncbi:hypothetical protein Ga0100231_007620 [Opitutaceae bacterium TAV4]|nr:hypothetical protein Ga0100231_007620 [Opitutaceae bacterium TAV4]